MTRACGEHLLRFRLLCEREIEKEKKKERERISPRHFSQTHFGRFIRIREQFCVGKKKGVGSFSQRFVITHNRYQSSNYETCISQKETMMFSRELIIRALRREFGRNVNLIF